jgi:hypothetical protein
MTLIGSITLLGLFTGLYVLGRWARRRPHDTWVHALWDLALSPRTDVSHMTRRELFESAGSIVTWTLLGILLLELAWLFVMPSNSPWANALPVGVGIVLLSGAGATMYMLARGLFRRRAYLSHERFSEELAVMRYWICRGDWGGLEAHFRAFAERTCGRQTATTAAAVDLDDYCARLARGLRDAVAAATGNGPTVIVYLHRPDEAWTGAFCVYRSAAPAAAPPRRMDACIAELPGPTCAPFAELFVRHGDTLNAVALFLVARTVAALGRCTDYVPLDRSALCMAFEGDGGLVWLREPASPSTDV